VNIIQKLIHIHVTELRDICACWPGRESRTSYLYSMNTLTRKERERAAREADLLDRAYELVCEHGLVSLQMSHLAAAGEVAMGTLYSHFCSKEDLLLALSTRSSTHRMAQIRRAVGWDECTRMRMLAIAMADWLFMDEHPHYAQIDQYAISQVVWERASAERRIAFAESREPIGALVHEVVRDARACGDLQEQAFTVEETPFGLWTMLIGTNQLTHAAGLLEHFQIEKPYQLMVRHLTVWLNGMQWQPLMSPDDTALTETLCTRLQTEVFSRENDE